VPTDVVMLSVTALLAVMALAAAVVAVRAARRSTERLESASQVPAVAPETLPRAALVPLDDVDTRSLAPRHVEGRVIVPPTGQQVVAAALSRPHVRLAILLHGLTYALRPESRDRITALMRREYRRRRRERLAAGRRAVRAVRPSTDAWMAEPWIGELPARPRSSAKVDS
jgi:soluble lytic murein transglycosylase-like protein